MGAAIANFFSLEDEYEKLQKNLKENIPKKINGEASEKIQESNNEEKEISEDNNGIQSGISDNNIISADKEIKNDKISTVQNTCMISADKKEEEKEKEDEVNKTEEKNISKIDDINDLIFPIFKIQKQEESKNPEYDSLSTLNKALSLSQIDFYSMNLKFPDSVESTNNFSSQGSFPEKNPIINPAQNSDYNFFSGNSQYHKFFGRKNPKYFNIFQFIPVTFSCSLDTYNAHRSRRYPVQKEKEFFEKIIKIADVTNITEFWEVFQHIKKPSQCPVGTDYHIFKRGVLPMWEDNMNKDGGKLSVLLTWKYVDIIWEEVAFSFSKGLFPYFDNLNGIVISMRPKFLILSFWLKTRNNNLVEKIRYALATQLQTPSHNCFDFIPFN